MAFVFVQHLSPQHESALPALLSARTALPVVQATDGLRIEANHVYVMPPNVHMEVTDGHLNLLPRPHDRSQFTPIDVFFESLARWAQERAIGVILSGTASDGSIIAFTGYGSSDDIIASREAGFDDHVVKPIDLDRLLSALDPQHEYQP